MKIKRKAEESKIKDLYLLTSKIEDDETQAHMSKFLCVQSSGYLENVVKSLIESYLDKSCPQSVSRFVQKKVSNLTNLEFEKLCSFLDSFDSNWKLNFANQISDEQKAALNSIISQRNAIAHGNPSSITFNSINNYFKDLEDIIIILESVIKK